MTEREQTDSIEPTPGDGLPEGGAVERDRRHAVLEEQAQQAEQQDEDG